MKLVDKMILFSRFLRNNKLRKLEIDELLSDNIDYFQEQSRYWQDKSAYQNIDTILSDILALSDQYNLNLAKLDDKINDLLRQEEVTVIQRDYDIYSKETPTFELMQERANIDSELLNEISIDVGYYSDWRFAGVELNPSTGLLTKSMLACDPLYLYTGNIADVDSIKSKFNNFFSNKRLMIYDAYHKLPQGQLGLATSINHYEFLPIDPIKEEMQQVYNLLRPGGHFIFTYNDCEKEAGLDFLSAYRAYNTRTLMKSLVEMLGFVIVKEQCFREANSWMVVKKPGELHSQKLTAPLVQIKV